jgi:hypothetical protein
MANLAKALFRGAATTNTATVLYTVPASTSTVITNIIVTNTSTAGTFTLLLDGVAISSGTAIGANAIVTLDLKQVLATTKTITGGASATSINFHISGMEIA